MEEYLVSSKQPGRHAEMTARETRHAPVTAISATTHSPRPVVGHKLGCWFAAKVMKLKPRRPEETRICQTPTTAPTTTSKQQRGMQYI